MAEPDIVKKWPMYVTVMDGRRADIYCRESRAAGLRLVQSLEIETPSTRDRDLVSDDAGRSFDSAGHGRHRMEPKTSAARHASSEFVAAVVAAMQKALDAHRFEALAIAAPPRTLGTLRAAIKPPLQARVLAEIAKDLTAEDAATIERRIDDEVARLHGPLAHVT